MMFGLQTTLCSLLLLGPAAEETPPTEESTDPSVEEAAPAEEAGPAGEGAAPIVELGGAPVAEGPTAQPEAVSQATDAETAPGPGGPPPPPPAATVTKRERPRRVYEDIPIAWRIEAAATGGSNVIFNQSYLAFDDNRQLPGFDLALRADYRAGGGRVFLGGGLNYRRYTTDRGIFAGIANDDLEVHEPALALRLAIMAVEGIDGYAELSGGPSIMDVSVDYGSNIASQRKVTGMGTAMAGALFYLPKKWLPRKGSSRFTIGLDGGFGYAFRGNVDIKPVPDVEDDAIDTQNARFGSLVTRGLTWRLGLFIRVM